MKNINNEINLNYEKLFNRFIEEFDKKIENYCYSKYGSYDNIEIEELKQEVYIIIWKVINNGLGLDYINTRLWRIMENAGIDMLRKATKGRRDNNKPKGERETITLINGDDAFDMEVDVSMLPDELYEYNEIFDNLSKHFTDLENEVLKLLIYEGVPGKEVAKIFNHHSSLKHPQNISKIKTKYEKLLKDEGLKRRENL